MRVFSVPISAPFLRTVIAALIDGGLVDGFDARAHPEKLATATLYLPTRRAGRMAHGVFLDVLGTDAVILPRIVALGDIDEDELAFSEDSEPGGIAPLDIPPKLGELVKIGVARGRKTRPDLKVGICGEHGGDPASVAFCHEIGLDYVSCSPYRVPIARLAAAQAALGKAVASQA